MPDPNQLMSLQEFEDIWAPVPSAPTPVAPSQSLSSGNDIEKFLMATEAAVKTKKKAASPEEPRAPMPAVKGFLFGCDPELFVRDRNGGLISAHDLLPGTKAEPFPVEDGAIQVDGMAAEFNITPSASFEDFSGRVKNVMRQLQERLPEGCTLDCSPAVVFPEDVFDAAPDSAKELGCTPDFNAWTGGVNAPPHCDQPRLRTASGHLHIGWTDNVEIADIQHVMNCRDLVKQFDWYLGGWSIKHDPDPTRRVLYGQAGAHRVKPYGVEYRVLSNFWLKSDDMMREVWNRMQQAINDMARLYLPDRVGMAYNKALVSSINTSEMYKGLPVALPFPLESIYGSTRVYV